MSEDKERTVNLGCGVWFLTGLIIAALWGISDELRGIHQALLMTNCLTEAAHGITCSEAKKT